MKSPHSRDLRGAIILSAASILIASVMSLRAAPMVPALGTAAAFIGPAPEAVWISPGREVDLRKLPKLTAGQVHAQTVMPFRVPNPATWLTQRAAGTSALAGVPAAQTPLQTVLSPPTLGTNFAGINQPNSDCGCEPPDTNAAAGPDQVVEVVNLALQIFDKSGNPLAGPVSLNSLFRLGNNFSSDPKVRYDPGSQRWFISMLSLNMPSASTSTTGQIDLAVSNSSDLSNPTWTIYHFPTPSNLPDQPDIGFSADKVVVAANGFACLSAANGGCNAGGSTGNLFFIIDKADLTSAASSPRAQFFPPGQDPSTFSIQPARMMPGTSPQPTTLYMAAVVPDSSNFIHVFTVEGLPNSSTVQITPLSINSLLDPPLPHQPSGVLQNNDNDNRLQDAVWQDGSLWVSANSACTPAGDSSPHDCLRFIEVLTNGGAGMEVNQDFDYGTPGTDYYYPAVALDQSDNLVSVFSRSSSSEYPSVYFASRLQSDPLDSMSYPVLIESGQANYLSTYHRWGDYSGASVDPTDGSQVWVGGEYATAATSPNWGTWIAEVQAGSTSGPTPTATPTATPTPAPLPGKLKISTRRLRFGKTHVGTPKTRTLTIKNKGKGPLNVSLGDPGSPFSIVGGQTSFAVSAGQMNAVAIQFDPGTAGRTQGSLMITSSDPRHRTTTITLVGKGLSP
jgi:HYDIN/CFA65/VesB-like, Ig-like domain